MSQASTWEIFKKQIDTMDTSEQLSLIAYLVEKIQNTQTLQKSQPKTSLVAMIGSGQGCYNSATEADRFIHQERNQWD